MSAIVKLYARATGDHHKGSFADKNVGANKAVTVSGYSLSGSDAGNYTLVRPNNVTASITARPLTISATGSNRAYDGLTDAAVTLADNRVAGDVLTTSYASAAFADQNAGTSKTVSVSGISLSGADAGNYSFNNSAADLVGTLTYGGTSQGATNVGSYSIIPGGLTSTNYTITFLNGTLTIKPASLAAIGSALNESSGVLLSTNNLTSTTDSTLTTAP